MESYITECTSQIINPNPFFIWSCFFPDQFYGKVDLAWNEKKARKGARKPKPAKELPQSRVDAIKAGNEDHRKQYWHEEPILMKSPLARNKHPENQFWAEEEALKQDSIAKGKLDAPLQCEVIPEGIF